MDMKVSKTRFLGTLLKSKIWWSYLILTFGMLWFLDLSIGKTIAFCAFSLFCCFVIGYYGMLIHAKDLRALLGREKWKETLDEVNLPK